MDSAIEAVGNADSFAGCVRATRPGGTISNVGYHGKGDVVPIPRIEWPESASRSPLGERDAIRCEVAAEGASAPPPGSLTLIESSVGSVVRNR